MLRVRSQVTNRAAKDHGQILSFSTEFGVVARALNLHEQNFFFRMFSLTVANSPVGSVACASMSLKVLATVDRGTNSCRAPFLPKR